MQRRIEIINLKKVAELKSFRQFLARLQVPKKAIDELVGKIVFPDVGESLSQERRDLVLEVRESVFRK